MPFASCTLDLTVPSTRLQRLVQEHPDLGEKAPILQAMLEIRSADAAGPDMEALQPELRGMLTELFPTAHEEWEMQADFVFESGAPVAQARRLKGLIFGEPSGVWTLHVRRDNFLLVRLSQYPGWNNFVSFAKTVWRPFVEVVRPSKTQHLSVRYINRLPVGYVSYSACTPEIIGEQVEFYQRTSHRHPCDARFGAFISHGTAPSPGPAGMMLDTTTHIHADISLPSDDVWELFEDLRTYKNDIFFTHHKEPHAA